MHHLANGRLGVFRFHTLKQRLVFIVLMEVCVIIGVLVLASYSTIRSIENNKLKTSMVLDLQQITDKMTEQYRNMTQISQQMSTGGAVGSLLNSYFESGTNFEKYVSDQQISQNLINITFANMDIVCRAYYDPVDKRYYFNNYTPNIAINTFNSLLKTGVIQFHPLHRSTIEGLAHYQVISLARSISLDSGRELIIYLESRFEAQKQIDNLSVSQHMNYVMLQLDASGHIQYSNSDEFRLGDRLGIKGEERVGSGFFGRYGKFVTVRQTSDMDFTNILLLPSADYNREFNAWILDVMRILVISLIVFAVSMIALLRLIVSPLSRFMREMGKLGRGDLNEISIHTGVREYDKLFQQFNTMKLEIQNLLIEAEKMAHDKHMLEIEKIYYQINPHFLMNALHSIHWLAKMNGQHQTEAFITELNYILAYSLGKIDKQATIRSEIKMLMSYLELQKMRYDVQVHVVVEEGGYLDTPTARLILQPLAENAIQHGLGEEGVLRIQVGHDPEHKRIRIVLEDNGRGLAPDELKRMNDLIHHTGESGLRIDGIGIRYVHSMLESFYGDKASMVFESEVSQGTKVSLLLPAE